MAEPEVLDQQEGLDQWEFPGKQVPREELALQDPQVFRGRLVQEGLQVQ